MLWLLLGWGACGPATIVWFMLAAAVGGQGPAGLIATASAVSRGSGSGGALEIEAPGGRRFRRWQWPPQRYHQ